MEAVSIISIILIFFCSILSGWASKKFTPGTNIMYGQAFASGSFLSLSLLQFSAKAAKSYGEWANYPWYSLIILMIFIFFSVSELKALNDMENQKQKTYYDDDHSHSYGIYLAHRFDVVPSVWLQIIVYIFVIFHSIIIGFNFSGVETCSTKYMIGLAISCIIEKIIESFTLSLLMTREEMQPLLFWALLILYSITTPMTMLILILNSSFTFTQQEKWVFSSISCGLFLYIGLFFWRKTFMTPFEWKKNEIIISISVFIAGIIIIAVLTMWANLSN